MATLNSSGAIKRTDRRVDLFDAASTAPAPAVPEAVLRAAEVEDAYESRAAVAARREAIEVAFDAARGDWDAEARVLQDAKTFDVEHPSRDPLFEELHAVLLFARAA